MTFHILVTRYCVTKVALLARRLGARNVSIYHCEHIRFVMPADSHVMSLVEEQTNREAVHLLLSSFKNKNAWNVVAFSDTRSCVSI
jgi:hypothetical protein